MGNHSAFEQVEERDSVLVGKSLFSNSATSVFKCHILGL